MSRFEYDSPLDYIEESLRGAREQNEWTELERFREKYRRLLIRYGGAPRYAGYAGWVVPGLPEHAKPLLWGDKSRRAKLNRNYRYIYNEAEGNFDLIDMKTDTLIGRYYAPK